MAPKTRSSPKLAFKGLAHRPKPSDAKKAPAKPKSLKKQEASAKPKDTGFAPHKVTKSTKETPSRAKKAPSEVKPVKYEHGKRWYFDETGQKKILAGYFEEHLRRFRAGEPMATIRWSELVPNQIEQLQAVYAEKAKARKALLQHTAPLPNAMKALDSDSEVDQPRPRYPALRPMRPIRHGVLPDSTHPKFGRSGGLGPRPNTRSFRQQAADLDEDSVLDQPPVTCYNTALPAPPTIGFGQPSSASNAFGGQYAPKPAFGKAPSAYEKYLEDYGSKPAASTFKGFGNPTANAFGSSPPMLAFGNGKPKGGSSKKTSPTFTSLRATPPEVTLPEVPALPFPDIGFPTTGPLPKPGFGSSKPFFAPKNTTISYTETESYDADAPEDFLAMARTGIPDLDFPHPGDYTDMDDWQKDYLNATGTKGLHSAEAEFDLDLEHDFFSSAPLSGYLADASTPASADSTRAHAGTPRRGRVSRSSVAFVDAKVAKMQAQATAMGQRAAEMQQEAQELVAATVRQASRLVSGIEAATRVPWLARQKAAHKVNKKAGAWERQKARDLKARAQVRAAGNRR